MFDWLQLLYAICSSAPPPPYWRETQLVRCRFRGHHDWVFHEAGGGGCNDGSSGREFKIEAVRLIEDRGVSVAQASRDLDVHENVLRK